jgi:4-hydroxybenzoate polyprenyltransferase
MGILLSDLEQALQDEGLLDRPAMTGSQRAGAVRIRPVALPVEHGGWGLLLEPIVLGLVIAPSLAGMFLSIAATGAFLARHPLRLVIADRKRGRRFPRTALAERFVLLYGLIASVGMLGALATAASFEFLLPLLIAAPFALIQIGYDAAARGRSLIPELAGSMAMAATAPALALAAGWPRPAAFALWIVLAARVVPAIIYVRARLAVMHGQPRAWRMALCLHAIALASVFALVWTGMLPRLAAVALLILFARAVYGLTGLDRATSAKSIGFREIGFGVMTVAAVAVGHYFTF